jgi:F-type H+-transporting ATPase subunit epsilon
MADALTLELVTPEREVVRESVAEVHFPGAEGYLGVLPGHTPLLTAMGIGTLSYRKGTERHYLSVAGGLAEVLPERVTILADAAERPEEIDVERARAALSKAEERLATGASNPSTDWTAVLEAIARARARLDTATHTIAGVSRREGHGAS